MAFKINKTAFVKTVVFGFLLITNAPVHSMQPPEEDKGTFVRSSHPKFLQGEERLAKELSIVKPLLRFEEMKKCGFYGFIAGVISCRKPLERPVASLIAMGGCTLFGVFAGFVISERCWPQEEQKYRKFHHDQMRKEESRMEEAKNKNAAWENQFSLESE